MANVTHSLEIHSVCSNRLSRNGWKTKQGSSVRHSPYDTVFSLALLILVLLAAVGLLFQNDPAGAWNKITEQMSYFLDKSAVDVVQNIAQKASFFILPLL